MIEYEYDTEKPPLPGRVAVVHVRAGAGAVPEVRLSFGNNPGAAEPFARWLRSPWAWEAFGEWYDSTDGGR